MRTDKGVVKIVDLGVSHHPNLKICFIKEHHLIHLLIILIILQKDL